MSERWLLAKENFRLALDVMRSHPLRSALVVLGVAIGVATLMTMVTLLNGVGAAIKRDMASMDSAVVYVAKFDFLGGHTDESVFARPDITPRHVEDLARQCPAVGIADYYIEPSGFDTVPAHHAGHKTRPLWVLGGGERFHHFYTVAIEEGRALGAIDIARSRRACVLGFAPAQELFPEVDPIGKRIRLGAQEYEVVGVYSERQSLAGDLNENYAVLPYTTFFKDWKSETSMGYGMLSPAPGYTTADVERQVHSTMRRLRRLRPGEADNFSVISADAVERFIQRITGPIALLLVVISSIGLMVGGIGVMNIMLVSVTERTAEIGLRLALGARRQTVLGQIMTEAVTLTGLGGVLGVAAGAVIAFAISRLTGLPAALSVPLVVGAVLFSMAIGVVFGMAPARRAAYLDPIAALRHE